MGFYERRVFPWLADRMTSRPEILEIKKDAPQSARGRVVEIGMHGRLKHHLGSARVPVETLVGDAEGIPLPDKSVVACGCNLNRPVVSLVERAGFRFETVRRFYMDKAPRPVAWMTVGTAAKLGN